MMQRFCGGDGVRVDIPEVDGPDFEEFHGRRGVGVDVMNDDTGRETSDVTDSAFYTVDFPDGSNLGFRWRNFRHG